MLTTVVLLSLASKICTLAFTLYRGNYAGRTTGVPPSHVRQQQCIHTWYSPLHRRSPLMYSRGQGEHSVMTMTSAQNQTSACRPALTRQEGPIRCCRPPLPYTPTPTRPPRNATNARSKSGTLRSLTSDPPCQRSKTCFRAKNDAVQGCRRQSPRPSSQPTQPPLQSDLLSPVVLRGV